MATAIVTGAGHGLGREAALALVRQGVRVVGVGRDHAALAELEQRLGTRFVPEIADVTLPQAARDLVGRYRPSIMVLCAGAVPPPARIQDQTWEGFSLNWHQDVQHVFHFVREALGAPLPTGSVVISMSSGAAIAGAPLGGGYAGAKAAVRYISSYARLESERTHAGIRFVALLPVLTQAGRFGQVYIREYAAAGGMSEPEFLQARFGGELDGEHAGTSIAQTALDATYDSSAYLLGVDGLRSLD